MKNKFAYTAIIIASLSLSACKDFLTQEPPLSQSSELTLSTYEGLDKATAGAYSYLASSGWYGGDWVLSCEMRSGNGEKNLGHNSNRYATELNWNYLSDATSAQWLYTYYTVAKCNNVIDNLAGKESASVSSQDLNNLKAECLFLRALSHFDCVRIYAQPYSYVKAEEKDHPAVTYLGVPYIYHTNPSAKPARETVEKVYENIVADLLEAESIIDPSYCRKNFTSPKASVTLPAIQGLLSRVYLYMEEWDNSAIYASKVIGNSAYSLYNKDRYKTAWKEDKGAEEVIFEAYIDMSNYSNLDVCYMTNPAGAYGDCLCSAELYALYEDGDVRKELYTEDKNAGHCSGHWTLKYSGKGLNEGMDANNTVIIRLSEMYLNRAEAGRHGAQGVDYLADLNAVAELRGASKYPSATIADIQKERRKELAWEGHYLYDLARWQKGVVRTADAFLMQENANIPFPSYKWALPIPKSEREVNKNLEQNPEWK